MRVAVFSEAAADFRTATDLIDLLPADLGNLR